MKLRFVFSWLLLAAVPALHGHTTEMLGGRIARLPDGVVELRLEVSALRLPVFADMLPESYATWGHVRGEAGVLLDRFQRSLAVFVEGDEVPPSEVELPGLARAADQDPLPAFVVVVARWPGLSFLPRAVIPRFDLYETTVMLLLDDRLGGSAEVDEAGRPAAGPADGPPEVAPATGSRGPMLWRALVVGFEHIVPHGLDHILFVLGLFFAARRVGDLVWQVTMFTVAHSLTLGLAMAGIVVLAPAWERAVEIAIAVSIVAVAFENCITRHHPGWRRLTIVGVFGLIHGLGFAGALSEVNWPAHHFVPALLAANIGIELGQLTVVGVAALCTAWAWNRPWYRRGIVIPASVALGLCGLYWAVERTVGAWSG